MDLIKTLAAQLPQRLQGELKRFHFRTQIKKGTFITDEPEYELLHNFLAPGDWVIDIGANIGHYTKRFSELVGENGRVIAFEPVPTTFSLLSANVLLFDYLNVSLINAAVSDQLDVAGMSIPKFSSGLNNYYQANISSAEYSDFSTITLSLDSLDFSQPIALVKIDAEGHEDFVLNGMQKLVERYKPILIVENPSENIKSSLTSQGYDLEKLPNSPNIIFKRSCK